MEVFEGSSSFRDLLMLLSPRDRVPVLVSRLNIFGRISFFCLLAGRISSRSTGTPRETRKRRRMRERIQLGGCKGGGATSWDQREAERSVRIGLAWEKAMMEVGEVGCCCSRCSDWGKLSSSGKI